jgi:type VI secretion system secreted protein VgrG
MTFTAGDGKLVGMAKEILLITEGGSFIRLGDDITFGTKGSIVHHGAKFAFTGPSTMPVQFPRFGAGATDLKFAAQYFAGGEDALQAPDLKVKIGMPDGGAATGNTDGQGKSDLLKSDALKIAALQVTGEKK